MQTYINMFKQNNDHIRIIRKIQFSAPLTKQFHIIFWCLMLMLNELFQNNGCFKISLFIFHL